MAQLAVMARPKITALTTEQLLFLQLYVAADGSKSNAELWAQSKGREVPTPSDRVSACRFLGRPMTQEVLQRWRDGRPLEGDAALAPITVLAPAPPKPRSKPPDQRITRLQLRAQSLASAFVERAEMIAYWEQVLLVGAHEVLKDIQGANPTLSHLVESCEVTDTGMKIRMPSKMDAAKVLTQLKGLGQATVNEERRRTAEENFANSEFYQDWKRRMAEKVYEMERSGEMIEGEIVQPKQDKSANTQDSATS